MRAHSFPHHWSEAVKQPCEGLACAHRKAQNRLCNCKLPASCQPEAGYSPAGRILTGRHGILKRECAVRPTSIRSAAMPEEATGRAACPWGRTYAGKRLYRHVLPMPPGPSTKNTLPCTHARSPLSERSNVKHVSWQNNSSRRVCSAVETFTSHAKATGKQALPHAQAQPFHHIIDLSLRLLQAGKIFLHNSVQPGQSSTPF